MKECFKCGIEKDFDEFYKHPEMADGHLGKCKSCAKIDVAKRYELKIDEIKAYERSRFKDPKRKKKIKEYQKKHRYKNPVKYKANTIIKNAVRDKKIVRQSCEVCGDCKAEAHHEDYKKPLDIKWLCFKHHRKRHGQLHYVLDNLEAEL